MGQENIIFLTAVLVYFVVLLVNDNDMNSSAILNKLDSRIIILRWSIPKLEYSMIPKIYFTKLLSKNTANRCKII